MLRIAHLYKSFGSEEVLRDLNLSVEGGSIFGLVGVNGAGKSTFLRLIAGVYQSDSGRIFFDGKDTWKEPDIRRKISFVSDEQYFPMGSTLESMKVLYESMYDFDEEAFRRYLKIFELNPKKSIRNLSKGMKRRCGLLLALSTHPQLLLMDEAYDGLEPIARLKLKQLLAELVDDEKITVIISSHNLRELEDICDSYGILEDGRMLTYGDLLGSRENVNKYQIAFSVDIAQKDLGDLDILHFEKEGRVIRAVIRGNREEITKKLNLLNPIFLDVLPVSFEEMFIYEVEKRGESDE